MILYVLMLYVNYRLVKYFGGKICLYYLWLWKLSEFWFTFWNLRSPYSSNPQINYSVKMFSFEPKWIFSLSDVSRKTQIFPVKLTVWLVALRHVPPSLCPWQDLKNRKLTSVMFVLFFTKNTVIACHQFWWNRNNDYNISYSKQNKNSRKV